MRAVSTPDPRTCVACGRQIEWRKKWARDWDQVRYCSTACRKRGVSETDRRLEESILDLLGQRAASATICPSEAARAVAGDETDAWRDLMEPARRAARRLVDRGDVEITQQGLRQVNVQPKIGFTFEKALRSFLRLDPDIIMIGEMRDLETASSAIEASLTGHMVFSTLHTNNAPETLTRLLDMGLDPYTFGDSLLMVLAQRLIRTLCKDCKEKYSPGEEEWDRLRREFADDALWEKQAFDRTKVELCRPKGCDRCNKTGYRGRAGIHEMLVVDDEIRQMIYQKMLSSKIRAKGIANGMVMLKQDGIRKIIKGVSDLTEVRSVCIK